MYVSFKELPPLPEIRIPAVLKKAIGYDEYLITIKKKVSEVFPLSPIFILLFCIQNYAISFLLVIEITIGTNYRHSS